MMNWVVSSSVLILIIITIRHLLKGKMSLRLQYALWFIVAARLLFPFSIGEATASVGTWLDTIGDRQEVQEFIDYTQKPITTLPGEGYFDSVPEKRPEQGNTNETIPEDVLSENIEIEIQNPTAQGYTPEEIAKFLWAAGMLLMGAGFLFSNIHFSLKLTKDRRYIDTYGKLKVYLTNEVETPCLYGLFMPAIYVTDEAVAEERCKQHVLEHEMTHYRHGDYIWSLVRVVCLVIHWYNPLVWWAAMLSRNDAELACDEATIKRLGEAERTSYGRTLIGLTCEKRPAVLITATTMTGSKRSIKERIKLIAQKPKMAVITLLAIVLLVATAIGWTFAGAKSPYDSFSKWADAIHVEDLKYFHLHKGTGEEEVSYNPTRAEFNQFLEILQSISDEDCYRSATYADAFEDAYVFLECGDVTANLQCLKDKTLLYVYTEPNFAPQGKKMIIDSPELWDYIVKLVDEKGKQASNNITTKVECIYETTADLNHDGIPDEIKVIRTYDVGSHGSIKLTEVSSVQVQLKKADGTYEKVANQFNRGVGASHSINGIYVLTEKEEKAYLLYAQCWEGHGGATYTYSVLCFNGTEVVTIEEETIEFWNDPYHWLYWDIACREDVIPEFRAALEPWIENGIILACYDEGEPILASSEKQVPASVYFDTIWARNSDERLAEFEQEVGKEAWQRELYFKCSIADSKYREWIEKNSEESFAKWYTQYDGSKLQRIDNYVKQSQNEVYSGSIPDNDEVIYYRASAGEDAQDAIYKMMECMIKERMIPSEDRTCTYTAYAIPEQKMYQVTEHMWFVPFLKGYYAFEGYDLCTMQELIDSGEPVTEDGLISFMAQGSEDVFFHILIEKDGVYRLERLRNMMK